MACVLRRLGEREESERYYRRAQELEPHVTRQRKYETEWRIIDKF